MPNEDRRAVTEDIDEVLAHVENVDAEALGPIEAIPVGPAPSTMADPSLPAAGRVAALPASVLEMDLGAAEEPDA